MHIVHVDLPGRAYAIHIGAGLVNRAGALLAERCSAERATIITDDNVGPLYGDPLAESIELAGFEATILGVPAGDASKSLEIAGQLYDELADGRHARDEPIIALGGGMVGDLAGFVAATWHRGVPFVQVPTTLEADIDAAVGGKTALNHAVGKNLIGAFHQPVLVCTDIACLETLADRDYRAGLAESVKHAVVADAEFLAWQERNLDAILSRQPDVLAELIRRNCAIKAAIVASDERETSCAIVGRAALNFGHTIGHAIEAACGYELRHGEAVALGMMVEMDLAVRLSALGDVERRRVEELLARLQLPHQLPKGTDTADIVARLDADKKVTGGTPRFVLPAGLGEVRWSSPPSPDILDSLARVITP